MEDGQLYDLSFKTPKTTFKNCLDLIPAAYTKSIEGVQTTGEFTINGKVAGKYTPTTIPKLDIRMLSNNASFNQQEELCQHPHLHTQDHNRRVQFHKYHLYIFVFHILKMEM